MRKLLFISATVIALTVILAACREDHDGVLDESYESQVVDIVTYTGLDADGHATFRLDGRDDEPAVQLLTGIGEPEKVTANQRVMLRYAVTHKAADAWNVRAMSLSRIISDSLRVNTEPLDTYARHAIKLTSLWRTGEFINIHGQAEYTGKTRHLYLMLDRDTRTADTCDVYLVHDLLPETTEQFFFREFYASVNIGVLKRDTEHCRVMRIHINDKNNPSTPYRYVAIK